MASRKGSSRENVTVVCRVRPPSTKELTIGTQCVKIYEDNLEVSNDDGTLNFQFDKVFGPDSSQTSVFTETASHLISDVLEGYNATIFAYGQTGTGKTYTMEGNIHDSNGKGIIPRSVDALFNAVLEADESIEFTFKVSYIEIYMEKIRDLLDETKLKTNLSIREDKVKGIYIAGVTEEYVTSHEELLSIMASGANNRATAATGMNEGSSRSHSVFTITVNQHDLGKGISKTGKLVLVDLAGSEMVRKTNASGQQLEEAKTINKSLSSLGQVIYALTDERQHHIPYRDSKLTRILQDSLGGNAKTVLIVAVSPSSYNANETVSTLRFGTRAKSIENKVHANQTKSVEELENLLMRAEKAIDAQTTHILSLVAQIQQYQAVDSGSLGRGQPSDPQSCAAIARAEADAANIQQLGDMVATLQQELDDERLEGKRKDQELSQLTALVKEKEKIIQEFAEVLGELKQNHDVLRDRNETIERERTEFETEYRSVLDAMQQERAQTDYNLQELQLRVQTLEGEKLQLQEQVEELCRSPDSSEQSSTSSQVGQPSESVDSKRLNASHAGESVESLSLPHSSKHLSLSELISQLSDLCKSDSTTIDSFVSEASAQGLLLEQKTSQKSLSEEQFERERIALQKRVKELETHRSRLEQDLQNRTEKVVQVQLELQRASESGSHSEQDRLALRSLQQRLEQLVAVHRQLLRKFAVQELENAELKKKNQLRDERIQQLETLIKTEKNVHRVQAEKSLQELFTLQEQIKSLRKEHQQRIDAFRSFELNSLKAGSTVEAGEKARTFRGGGGHKVTSPEKGSEFEDRGDSILSLARNSTRMFSRVLGSK